MWKMTRIWDFGKDCCNPWFIKVFKCGIRTNCRNPEIHGLGEASIEPKLNSSRKWYFWPSAVKLTTIFTYMV